VRRFLHGVLTYLFSCRCFHVSAFFGFGNVSGRPDVILGMSLGFLFPERIAYWHGGSSFLLVFGWSVLRAVYWETIRVYMHCEIYGLCAFFLFIVDLD
jgi:hypothetical protein